MIEILWKMKWSCFQVSFVYSWIIDYRNLFWELSDKNVILFIDGHKRIYELPWGRLIYMVTNFDYLKNESKVAVQKALDETQLLFDSLMQQYFG